MSSLLLPVFQLSRENTQPENMCDVNFENIEAVVQRCSVKKVFLEISQNSQGNTCARVSYLIKLQALVCKFIKQDTLAQTFSCEFCEISKNTFLHRTPLVAASENTKGISAEATVQRVLQKRCYEKFRRIHMKTFSRISFFDKVILCRSAVSLKPRPWRRIYLAKFAKFVRTPFFCRAPPEDCF